METDEGCERVNVEKDACRANAIQVRAGTASNKYRQALLKERNLYRQLDEEAFRKEHFERHLNEGEECNQLPEIPKK
jgi:hypothetical protein